MQGRFNLNSLVTLDRTASCTVDQPAIERFERLLEMLELETKWARDHRRLDRHRHRAEFPDGAEDPIYTA